jgi:hypothetical protein
MFVVSVPRFPAIFHFSFQAALARVAVVVGDYARLRSDMLRSSGFNIMGLTLNASIAVYKTFVRPMVEWNTYLTLVFNR